MFAVGLSLILRPFVDFVSDARYQKHKLRVWNARPPWHPRVLVIPRLIALPVAIAMLVLVSASFLWALYLTEEWITQHWQTKEWNDRFIARINELADFTDKIALRILGDERLRARVVAHAAGPGGDHAEGRVVLDVVRE